MILMSLILSPAFAGEIVSKLGGKCLNAEGGIKDGARVIAFNCSGSPNENFAVDNGRLKIAGSDWCAQTDTTSENSEIHLRKCVSGPTGDKLQNFAFHGKAIGHNTGYCMDLKGGVAGQVASNISWGNQPTILFKCNDQANQSWYTGTFQTGQTTKSIKDGTVFWVPGVTGMFEKRGDEIVSQGGGNLKNSGGKIVAQGGGNIVTQTGAN